MRTSLFPLALLTFSRASTQFVLSTVEMTVALGRLDVPRLKYAMRRVAFSAGEVLLFRAAIWFIGKAVGLFFYLELTG